MHAALLDIDGTFIASTDSHARAWSEAVRAHGFDKPPAFFRPLIGMGGDRIFPLVSPELREDSEIGKAISASRKDAFRSRYLPALKATPGARELVEFLAAAGLERVVASSAGKDELDQLLRVASIEDLVTAATTSDDADASKPASDIVAAALKKARVSASEAFMIGDTPHDITAASKLGVPTIAFRSGGWDDDGLSGAAEIYDDPADLLSHAAESGILGPLARR